MLRAKARLGLHQQRAVDLDAVPAIVGGARAPGGRATSVSERSITLIKDERNQVPLTVAARRAGAVSVGARLPVGLADRGAEPHVHSRS